MDVGLLVFLRPCLVLRKYEGKKIEMKSGRKGKVKGNETYIKNNELFLCISLN